MNSAKGRSDLFILLAVLLGFSLSMVLLVSTTQSQSRINNGRQENTLQKDFIDTAKEHMNPLIQARAVDHLARQIVHFESLSPDAIHILSEYVTDKQSSLSDQEKAQFLVALFFYRMQKKTTDIKSFLTWIMNHDVFKQYPFLFVAAQSPYRELIHELVQQSMIPSDNVISKEAFKYAVDHNNPGVMQRLLRMGIAIDSSYASELLLRATAYNKDVAFINLLLEMGADKDLMKQDMTPLMWAAKKGNKKAVQALLAAGANPQKKPADPFKNSAAQYARDGGYKEIEKMISRAAEAVTQYDVVSTKP